MSLKILACLFLTVQLAYSAKLPSEFGRCHRSDTKFNECVRKNLEGAIQFLSGGYKQLGLQPFEPLEIPSLVIGHGSGPVKVDQNFRDVHLHGLTGSKVLSTSVDFDSRTMYTQSITPKLILDAKYTMNGRILLLPVVGDGPCKVTLINTKINHTMTMDSVEKKGKFYWKVKKYTVTLRPERVTYKFDNLFNGQQNELGDQISQVINENWNEVFTDVRPGYEESFGLIFQDLANRVFSKVPVKDIFYFD